MYDDLRIGKFLKNLDQYPFIKQTIKKFAESMITNNIQV